MRQPKSGIFLAFLSLILLGIMPIISNSRPAELNALNYAFYLSLWQLAIAFPVMLIEYRTSNKGIFNTSLSTKQKKKTALVLLLTGSIFGISTFAYVLSIEKTGTVNAAIALQAYPLFAIAWESLFYQKKKTATELGFTLLLIAGLYYLASNGTWALENLSYWFLVALSVPFLWSVAHVIIKHVLLTTEITPAQITFFRVLISSFILMIIAILINGTDHITSGLFNTGFQQNALMMGLTYYLELIIWFYAVKQIDVSFASSITAPAPAVTLILAALLLHEPIKRIEVITLIVVFISLYGILYAGKTKL